MSSTRPVLLSSVTLLVIVSLIRFLWVRLYLPRFVLQPNTNFMVLVSV